MQESCLLLLLSPASHAAFFVSRKKAVGLNSKGEPKVVDLNVGDVGCAVCA